MTATPLVRQADGAKRPGPRRSWIPIAIVAVALALLAAGGGWWFLARPQVIPDWDRIPVLNLAAPAGDAFLGDTPWVSLQVAPARSGESNELRVQLTPRLQRGTPIPTSNLAQAIKALSVQSLSNPSAPGETLALQPDPESSEALVAMMQLEQAGWWRLAVDVSNAKKAAEFYLLIPDPNVNGPAAVPDIGSSPEGEALFQRGLDTITALRDVRFTQWISDGRGNSVISEHAVSAGSGDTPPGFTYRAVGGMEAVIIGSTRWIKLPADLGWQKQEGATVVLPSDWDEEYFGATGFTILGAEMIDGEQCQLLAFVVPELTEPRRQTVAWYLWWVGEETGYVHKEVMVSRAHYMLNDFSEFDVPISLNPPQTDATPVPSGTPIS